MAAESMMDRLPKEIILGILSRLPITCLAQSMLVCRAWRSLIKDPQFVSEHLSHCMVDNIDPIFVVQGCDQEYYFADLSDLNYSQGINVISMKPLNLGFKYFSELVGSCNGLLCILHYIRYYQPSIYICNPFTKQYLILPGPVFIKPDHRLVYPEDYFFDFGYNPTTKEYKVVAALSRRSSISAPREVHVLTVGSRAWRNIGSLPDYVNWEWKVKINGRLHWLSGCRVIISLDLATEQFEQFEDVPIPNCYCCGKASWDLAMLFEEEPMPNCRGKAWGWHLTLLQGCLSVNCYNEDKLEIWVMKEYGVKESWVKEFVIDTLNHVQYPRVVCMLKSGDILLYNCEECVYLYDQRHGTLVKKDLRFPRALVKDRFTLGRIVSHVGSLNWLDTPISKIDV